MACLNEMLRQYQKISGLLCTLRRLMREPDDRKFGKLVKRELRKFGEKI